MMVGGIYCEIPLNPPFYKADAVKGIHWRLNKILGMNVDFFRKEIIDGVYS